MKARRRQRNWQRSFARNLVSGDYRLIERLRRLGANLARRSPTRTCCGNYGEPGC
jgi:hypothetical protein